MFVRVSSWEVEIAASELLMQETSKMMERMNESVRGGVQAGRLGSTLGVGACPDKLGECRSVR